MGILSVPILRPNREAWIAAARRFKEALRTNPNMRVRFFGACRETVSGQTLNCDEVIVPLNQTIGGSGNAINESVIAGATEAQLREPGAAIDYTVLMWLDNQIAMGGVTDSSIPWGWILGIAVVGGGAAYLARKRRRGVALGANGILPPVIGRGFKGKMDWAQFEHDEAFRLIDDAIDYKIAGDVIPSAENLLMAFGYASSAGMLTTLASDGARTEDQKRRASKLKRSLLGLLDKSERGILSIIKECDQRLGPYQPPPTVNGLRVRRARLA